jgi:hypothetical protein
MLTDRIVAPDTYFKYLVSDIIGKEDVLIMLNATFTGEPGPERRAWLDWKRAFDRKVRMRVVEIDVEATALLAKAGLLDQIAVPKGTTPVVVCINTAKDMYPLLEYAKHRKVEPWTVQTLESFACETVAAAKNSSRCQGKGNANANTNTNANANAKKGKKNANAV